MVKEDKQRHQDLILKTIHHLEKIGHTDVKADISGYESPTSFSMKNRGTTVTPDIVSTTPLILAVTVLFIAVCFII